MTNTYLLLSAKCFAITYDNLPIHFANTPGFLNVSRNFPRLSSQHRIDCSLELPHRGVLISTMYVWGVVDNNIINNNYLLKRQVYTLK